MVAISNGLLIINPLIFRQAVLALSGDTESETSLLRTSVNWVFGSYARELWAWVLTLLAIAMISSFFKFGMRMAFVTVSRDAEFEIRSKLFNRIQSQSMAFFDRHGIGELLSRLTNDITAYRDLLGPGIMYPVFFLTLVGPGIFALFSISAKLASLAMIPLVAIPIVNFALRKRLYSLSTDVQKLLAEMSNLVQEHYSSIRIIKSYTMERSAWGKFKFFCVRFINVNLRLSLLQGTLFPFFTFLTKAVTVLLVLFSGVLIYKGWSELNTADFVSFMWIQSYIFFPVIMLGWLIPVYERGRAAYDRLRDIYEEPIEVKDQAPDGAPIQPLASIEFRNLTFTYPGAVRPALNEINLEIAGGSLVGITGPVSSGKSTLFRLLNREYEIPKGTILIGGRDIHEYPLSAFHREMATVEQVPFLFSRTIAENVRFGKREASQEEIEAVARDAAFHDTVMEFPEFYETLVGERGVTLSGGQKQRLAMARAFLVDRSILLLDDIFSAIDSSTESRIFQTMKENLKNKTMLLITHRVSILLQMDRVIYMADGQVLEDGNPQELMRQGGHFAALAELQMLERP